MVNLTEAERERVGNTLEGLDRAVRDLDKALGLLWDVLDLSEACEAHQSVEGAIQRLLYVRERKKHKIDELELSLVDLPDEESEGGE